MLSGSEKPRGYKYPFTQQELLQPLSEEDKIKAIESEDWDLIIKSHMRLGCIIACQYYFNGSDPDEMISAALLGLVEGVNEFRLKRPHDNITGYIIIYIRQYCSDVSRKDCCIPIPQKNTTKFYQHELGNGIDSVDNSSLTKINETLEEVVKCKRDRKILELRASGLTDAEVAKEIGISRSRVTVERQRLFKRFNQKHNSTQRKLKMSELLSSQDWSDKYNEITSNPPQDGAILRTIDGTPVKLIVEIKAGASPFIYARAYVPEILGVELAWFLQNEDQESFHGWKCILLPRARTELIKKVGLNDANVVFVDSLRVIRQSNTGMALLCEIHNYLAD